MMQDPISDIAERLRPLGFIVLGCFRPTGNGPRNGVMIGNAGSAMWSVFAEHCRTDPVLMQSADPLDQWTRQVLAPVATRLDAQFLHPSDGPPWHPFQRWGRDCGTLFASPLGLNIHPEFGLWTALRGALILPNGVSMPATTFRHPCADCTAQPCLSACPVSAFGIDGYAAADCRQELAGSDRADCMTRACAARRACPVGAGWQYDRDHAGFHMQAFRSGLNLFD